MKYKVIAVQLVIVAALGAVICNHADRLVKRYQATETARHLVRDAAFGATVAADKIRDLHRDAPGFAYSTGRLLSATSAND